MSNLSVGQRITFRLSWVNNGEPLTGTVVRVGKTSIRVNCDQLPAVTSKRKYNCLVGPADCQPYADDVDTFESLSDLFARWASGNCFDDGDAMDLLARDDITAPQRAWLSAFVVRWEAMEARRQLAPGLARAGIIEALGGPIAHE